MHAARGVARTFAIVALAAAAVAGASAQAPIVANPGPEQAVLKMDVGTWDATVELFPAPGAQAQVSKAVETNTIGCAGFCLVSDVKGEIMGGVVFAGHGITVWDPAKKTYVGSWADNMMPGMARSELTFDAAAKKHTGWMEIVEDGKTVKTRVVAEYPTPTTRTMTSYAAGPDGKEFVTMRISYVKK